MVVRGSCFSVFANKSYKIKKTRGYIYISNDSINMATLCTYRKNNVHVSLLPNTTICNACNSSTYKSIRQIGKKTLDNDAVI